MSTENSINDYLSQRNDITERVKRVLISSLNLNMKSEHIHHDEILFGAGLGLDSIDSLQLTVGIKSEFGVEIKDHDMWCLRSVNTLVDYIMRTKILIELSQKENEQHHNRLDNFEVNDKFYETYNFIRNHAVLKEIKNFTILNITGDDNLSKLNSIVTKDIDFTPEGSITHTLILEESGLLLSDIYFMNNFDNYFVLLPHHHSAEKILAIFNTENITYDNITNNSIVLSIHGYKADKIIENTFGVGVSSLKPYMFSMESLGDLENILVARLDSYGEYGFIIVAQNTNSEEFISYFNEAKLLQDIPEKIEQLFWLESCRFHHSVCFKNQENILEAGLSALVTFDKEAFRGKEAFETFHLASRLIHFRSDKEINAGAEIMLDNVSVGYVVACEYSPLLGKYIGNAYIQKNYSSSGITYYTPSMTLNISSISAPQIIGRSYMAQLDMKPKND